MLHGSPIGTERSLQTMTPDALREVAQKPQHRPDLQAVIVVGEIDPDEISSERSIKTLFKGDLPAAANARPRPECFDIPWRVRCQTRSW